jgi:DNA polymerase III subunit epsilon
MHWNAGERLLFDLESDSPDPNSAYMIQAAVVHLIPGCEPRKRKWLVQPRRPIPAEATAVHKITTEVAQRDGQPIEEVIDALRLELFYPDVPIIGHNISYDLTLTDREMGRVLGTQLSIQGPVVDTLLLDKACDMYRPGERTLASQCRHYGIELGDDAHDAMADCLAAGRLAHKIVARCCNHTWPRGKYPPNKATRAARELIASGDAVALHAAQIRWHEEGQLSLADYWRTPKAVEKAWEKVARGDMTEVECKAWIEQLPQAADRVAAQARGCWPLLPRVPATT